MGTGIVLDTRYYMQHVESKKYLVSRIVVFRTHTQGYWQILDYFDAS